MATPGFNTPLPLLYPPTTPQPQAAKNATDLRVQATGAPLTQWQKDQALGSSTSTALAAVTGKATTTSTQQMLKRLGFNVQVDGIMGPQTKAALQAQQSGIKAAVWNAHQATGNQTVPVPATTPAGNAGPQNLVSENGNATGSANGTGGSTSTAKDTLFQSILNTDMKGVPGDNASKILALQSLLSNNQVDPNLLATADANQQYNPVIQGLRQNIATQQAQGTQDQTDIKSWYDALVNNIGVRNDQNQTADTSAINAINSSTGGVAQALGLDPGSAGGSNIYQTGNIQSAAAQANKATDSSYGKDLQSVTASQGLTSLVNQRNIDSNKLSDLNSQERAQESARGNAITTGQAAYRQQNLTNREQYMKDKLGLQQAAAASTQTHFADASAARSQAIAQYAGMAKATNDNIKATADATYKAGALGALQTTAKARLLTAQAGNTKAITAGKLAIAKIATTSGGLFKGVSPEKTATALYNIGASVQANKNWYDPKGGINKSHIQDVVKFVGRQIAQTGGPSADPKINPLARYQAFNILESLGITPARGWYQ